MVAFVRQQLRGRQDLARGGAGLARTTVDVADVLRDLRSAARGPLDVAGDLLGCGALLLDRGGDRGRDLRDARDGRSDFLDSADRVLCCRLDGGDLPGNLLGRL